MAWPPRHLPIPRTKSTQIGANSFPKKHWDLSSPRAIPSKYCGCFPSLLEQNSECRPPSLHLTRHRTGFPPSSTPHSSSSLPAPSQLESCLSGSNPSSRPTCLVSASHTHHLGYLFICLLTSLQASISTPCLRCLPLCSTVDGKCSGVAWLNEWMISFP